MSLGLWSRPTELPDGPDCSSLDGARRLAEKINAIWAEKGVTANARPIMEGFNPAMRQHFYSIKSDLRNGLPRS
jgi:hypothetical protein